MTVGSVRGKLTFEIPVRVAQGGRSVVSVGAAVVVDMAPAAFFAVSVDGQTRLNPPFTDIVGWPHWAQNGLRAFQSRSWRASA
jgi:hypothetical protein